MPTTEDGEWRKPRRKPLDGAKASGTAKATSPREQWREDSGLPPGMPDEDRDGIPDRVDIDAGDGSGKAREGVRDPFAPPDRDRDGIPDRVDIDAGDGSGKAREGVRDPGAAGGGPDDGATVEPDDEGGKDEGGKDEGGKGKGGKGKGGRGGRDKGGREPSPDPYAGLTDWWEKQQEQARIDAAKEAKAAKEAAKAAAREQRQSVYAWAREKLMTWGFDSEQTKEVMGAIKGARTSEAAVIAIRETKAYKERFAGNIARAKAGYGMLSEAEYMAQESSYRNALKLAGLPEGFYDEPADFAKWIGGDVSAKEVGDRALEAGAAMHSKDPALARSLRQMYGLRRGELAAYALDPKRALPVLQRRMAAAKLGAEFTRAGLGAAKDGKWFNKLVSKGVTVEQAREAMVETRNTKGGNRMLSAVYGEEQSSKKATVKGELGLDGGKLERKKRRLASQERAAFGGSGGNQSAFGGSDGSF